jgi:hypothetical protein
MVHQGIIRIKYYSIDYLNKKLFFIDLFLILLLIFIFIHYFNLYYYYYILFIIQLFVIPYNYINNKFKS